MYLLAGAEVVTLGLDTLVVVDIVLPAVLGPGKSRIRRSALSEDPGSSVLVLLGETGVVTCDCAENCQSRVP